MLLVQFEVMWKYLLPVVPLQVSVYENTDVFIDFSKRKEINYVKYPNANEKD